MWFVDFVKTRRVAECWINGLIFNDRSGRVRRFSRKKAQILSQPSFRSFVRGEGWGMSEKSISQAQVDKNLIFSAKMCVLHKMRDGPL